MQRDLLSREQEWVEQARSQGRTLEAIRMAALFGAVRELSGAAGEVHDVR